MKRAIVGHFCYWMYLSTPIYEFVTMAYQSTSVYFKEFLN